MHWYQVVGTIVLVWFLTALILTPVIALFIRHGLRRQLRGEWADRRRAVVRREASAERARAARVG